AGGKIYQKKTQISEEHGYMGAFIDSEGNRVALHSQK
ncbi:MAG: VOC family protein, partial [Altibacter sp.]|nr:VOC family protein [Altibacter sp.]